MDGTREANRPRSDRKTAENRNPGGGGKSQGEGAPDEVDTIHKAAAYGHHDKLVALVDAAVPRTSTNSKAAYHTENVRLLESHDDDGYTALQWAALNNRLSIVTYLLDQGVDVNAQDRVSNQTALHWATVRGGARVPDDASQPRLERCQSRRLKGLLAVSRCGAVWPDGDFVPRFHEV